MSVLLHVTRRLPCNPTAVCRSSTNWGTEMPVWIRLPVPQPAPSQLARAMHRLMSLSHESTHGAHRSVEELFLSFDCV